MKKLNRTEIFIVGLLIAIAFAFGFGGFHSVAADSSYQVDSSQPVLKTDFYNEGTLLETHEIFTDLYGEIRFRRLNRDGIEVENRLANSLENERYLINLEENKNSKARIHLNSTVTTDKKYIEWLLESSNRAKTARDNCENWFDKTQCDGVMVETFDRLSKTYNGLANLLEIMDLGD